MVFSVKCGMGRFLTGKGPGSQKVFTKLVCNNGAMQKRLLMKLVAWHAAEQFPSVCAATSEGARL